MEKDFYSPAIQNEFEWFHPHTRPALEKLGRLTNFQITRLQPFEMINELFADTVVISHHEELFTSPSFIDHIAKAFHDDRSSLHPKVTHFSFQFMENDLFGTSSSRRANPGK